MKTVLGATLTGLMILGLTTSAIADSNYGNSKWPSKLDRGVLKVRGAGYGSWGKNWITVATNVVAFKEQGTSKGPVLIFVDKYKRWKVLQLHFSTGARKNVRHFRQPVSFVRKGRYGVLLKVGRNCYDHSWGGLRRVGCGAVNGRFM